MDIFNEMAEAKQPIDVDAEDVTVQTEDRLLRCQRMRQNFPEMSRLHRKKLLKNKKARSNPYNQDRNGQSGEVIFCPDRSGDSKRITETYMGTEKLFDIREELREASGPSGSLYYA